MAEHPVIDPGPVAESPLAVPPDGAAVIDQIARGALDAELAATVWRLIDDRVPVVIATPVVQDAVAMLDALLGLVPEPRHPIELAGARETFDWLPQAGELGLPGASTRPDPAGPAVRPETTVLVARRIAPDDPSATWALAARIAVRAATIGYGLLATIDADSLETVLAHLGAPPVGLTEDERSRLGVVLVLGRDDDAAVRVRAAHYVRPSARDEHGHVQRLGPAVLATWDPIGRRFEHFGWGIVPELARRVGCRAGDFEIDLEHRRALLDESAAGVSPADPGTHLPDPSPRG